MKKSKNKFLRCNKLTGCRTMPAEITLHNNQLKSNKTIQRNSSDFSHFQSLILVVMSLRWVLLSSLALQGTVAFSLDDCHGRGLLTGNPLVEHSEVASYSDCMQICRDDFTCDAFDYSTQFGRCR